MLSTVVTATAGRTADSQALVYLRSLTVMSGCAKCMKEDKQGEGVVCVGRDRQFYVA